MFLKSFVWAVLLCVVNSSYSLAAPILSVSPLGSTPDGNRQWIMQVAPDPDLFSGQPPSGSMAIALAFAIDDAELIDVEVNEAAWMYDLPGNNPFTNSVTFGLWLDLIGDRTFGAFGSLNFSSAEPVELFVIQTAGVSPTTVRYGEAASGDPVFGSQIAQAGQNFDGYTGSVTGVLPEPSAILLVSTGLLGLAYSDRRRMSGSEKVDRD